MRRLYIDIETYSSVDLAQCGVYRYALSEDFRVLLIAYAYDDEPVRVIDVCNDGAPRQLLEDIVSERVHKWAHNAIFERVCLSVLLARIGYIVKPGQWLDARSWRCSMVLAAMSGLPMSLADIGDALELSDRKMTEGKRLIELFCKPHHSAGVFGAKQRVERDDCPEDWATFMDYCRRDVEVEREIIRQCSWYPVREAEWELYSIDQAINDYGVCVDRGLAKAAYDLSEQDKPKMLQAMRVMTHLENPGSDTQLKGWLEEQLGHAVESLDKRVLPEILKEAEAADKTNVVTVLSMRSQIAKSSVSKYKRALDMCCGDGRLRGLMQFYGTRTGRWTSKGVQLQNLPQNHIPCLSSARDMVRAHDAESIELVYGSKQQVLSELIRTMFVARPGCRLCVCDFNAIEARILAWMAGEEWVLEAFRSGKDIYCETASQMFGVPVAKHGPNAELRQKGKVAVLALGYQGGVGSLTAMGAARLGMSEDEMTDLVRRWRDANRSIVALWGLVQDSVCNAVSGPGGRVALSMPHTRLVFERHNAWSDLTITLPSGRALSYQRMWQTLDRSTGRYELSYMTTGSDDKSTKRAWGRYKTYGGRLVENITQAIGRDILADVMRRVHEAGYKVVCHIHDELVIEVPDETHLPTIEAMFSVTPSWAEGLPLKGAGYICDFYYKD